MKIVRHASVAWRGGFKDGRGAISTASGALADYPYGYGSRFEGTPGSNPEELLGAAHAACFTMALTAALGQAGLSPTLLETTADVTLEEVEGGWGITKVHLALSGQVPGTDKAQFEALAHQAKAGCPVSKVLRADISLDITFLP